MGFVLNSIPGSNNSIEYLANNALYVWGGSNNALIANSNVYTLLSGNPAAGDRNFGSDIAIGANRIIVRSGYGNTFVYSLETNTVIYKPNNKKSGGYEEARQLTIMGDRMVIASGDGTTNVYSLNNTYISTLSYNATVVSETGFNTAGYALAAADNRIVVGMPRDFAGGQVRVFNYAGEMLFDIISRSYTGLINYFGDVVDVGDGVIVVGCPFTDYNSVLNSGYVEMYDYNGVFIKALKPATIVSQGRYGAYLSVGSGIIAIAYWERDAFDIYNTAGDKLFSVTLPLGSAISSIKVKYGKIFVGVPSLPSGLYKGKVFVYDLMGNLVQTIFPNTLNNARFGASIDVGYGYLAVGAITNSVSGTANVGSVFLYKISPSYTVEDATYITYNGD